MALPKAVLISDVHFNLQTLPLASKALSLAVSQSSKLKVPLIIAGDLHDTKALLRGECVRAIISILREATQEVIVLIGNHDLLNEKSKEHSLEFLKPFCTVIQHPVHYLGMWFVPYQADNEFLRGFLADRVNLDEGDTLIMHQGIKGAFMGEYVVDKTSIEPEALKDFRCISGHYHRAQHITCDNKKHASYGEPGVFSYIGTPYTVTFAEANDGPKGIQVLYTDGTLKQIPTNLRKHVIVERTVQDVMDPIEGLNSEDLLWLKVTGPTAELDKLSKKTVGMKHLGHQSFKLDKVYTEEVYRMDEAQTRLSNDEILDKMIDESGADNDHRNYLKALWREVMNYKW